MQQFDFDVAKHLFNVVVVWNTPCAGIPRRDAKVANADPLDWATANKWCHGILTGIGRDWMETKFVDIYIEPVNVPRPWTPEIYAAYKREQHRAHVVDPCRRQEIALQELAYLQNEWKNNRAAMGAIL